MRQYFGTDGIRGKVGSSVINPDFFFKLGVAVGRILSRSNNPTVLLGFDTRESCEFLAQALTAGLMQSGISVYSLGVAPTPVVAFLTASEKAAAGVVISASHNSYEDNGVKFFNHLGMKFDDAQELAIEAEIQRIEIPFDHSKQVNIAEFAPGVSRYIAFCQQHFLTQCQLANLTIVLDCAHGATYRLAPSIFSQMGADVIVIGDAPNGMNINKDCGATHLASLQSAVIANKAHLGVAFDGDGDRLIMVDDQGEIVDGDELLCILALNGVVEAGKGVVGTLMSNLGLEQALSQAGVDFDRAKVGDRYVLERLLANDWTLGGEASGHIINLNYATTGDGIMSALQVLAVMCQQQKSLFELKQVMTKQPQVLINVAVNQQVDLNQYPSLMHAAAEAEKQLAGAGRVLLRASGTEACVRVMVEGSDGVLIKKCAESLSEQVRQLLGDKS